MTTSVEVYRKLKEMSHRTLGSSPRVLLSEIEKELSIPADTLIVLLTELADRGLVKLHSTSMLSVSLTNYGIAQEDVSGGLNS